MSYTPFVATSPRAIAGIGFQDKILKQFKALYSDIKFEMVWDLYKERDPTLTDRQLAIIEKEQGDITFMLGGERHYVECCFAMGPKISRLCEMKRTKFIGANKYYCYGFASREDIIFIASFTWNKYTSYIKQTDPSCRIVPIKYILGLKNKYLGIENYMETIHNIKLNN